MIKSEDIRIGNYIDVNGIAQVRGVTNGGVWIRNKAFVIMDFKGIPLTPEILDKCGFEQDGEVIFNLPNTPAMVFCKDGIVDLYLYGHPIKKDIKYLHKLQNIIYENIDTELTITL